MSFVCEKCSGVYAHAKSLRRHLPKCTGVSRPKRSGNVNVIKCPECKQSFVNMEPLRTHIEADHNVKMEEETLFFKTVPEFHTWKKNMERESNSCYRQKAHSLSNDAKRLYFFCHRSGYNQSKAQGLRRHSSIKIDATCPSSMVVIESAYGVDITFCKTHFGHGLGLKRCLTEDERESIAGKIADGECFEEILDEVNDNTSNIYDSKALTTKQDLLNICQEYNHRIILNHNESKIMLLQIKFHQTSETSWSLESGSEKHIVTQLKSNCDVNNCSFKCRFCKVCTHLYACNCIGYFLKPKITICKHIHACVFKINSLRLQRGARSTNISDNPENTAERDEQNDQRQKVIIYYPTNGNCCKINVSK